MKDYRSVSRRTVVKGIAGSSIIGSVGTVSASDQTGADDHEIYIVLGGGSGLESRLARAGFEVRHELAGGAVFIVRGPKGKRDEIRSMAAVTDAVTNETYTVDETQQKEENAVSGGEPRYEKQWDRQLVRTKRAHDIATGEGTTIAVIDSGVSFSHPDLRSRIDADRSRLVRDAHIRSGVSEVKVAAGKAEPGIWLKPIETASQPLATDVDGHGTHVAGIAAASRNNAGIVGMAPDAKIVSLRTMYFNPIEYDNTTYGRLIGTIADLLIAIDYAVELGIDVVNVSLRVNRPSDSRAFAAFRRVVQHAIEQGTVVVDASGNDYLNLNQYPHYILPADTSGTITVAATGRNDKRVPFSNYGNSVDIAAPGSNILSTVPTNLYYSQQYKYKPGTSMATPQVGGLACLLRELAPELHPRRIGQAIEMGAVELTGQYASGLGSGRIDAPGAIERISGRL